MMMSLRNMLPYLACFLAVSAVGIKGMRNFPTGTLTRNPQSSRPTLSQRTPASASSTQNNRRRVVSGGTRADLENLIRTILTSAGGSRGFSYTFTIERAPQTDPGVRQPITIIREPATTANIRQPATTANLIREPSTAGNFITQQATAANLIRQQATAANLIGQQISQGSGMWFPNQGQPLGITNMAGLTMQFGLDAGQMDLILNFHNDARRDTDSQAADMTHIRWDFQLANRAFDLIQTCDIRTMQGQGGNLAWRRGQDIAAVVDTGLKNWSEEKKRFRFGQPLSQATQHYTQMIWSTSRNVGCAATRCPGSMFFFLCLYKEQGNIIGHTPYREGQKCSLCPITMTCLNGLCD